MFELSGVPGRSAAADASPVLTIPAQTSPATDVPRPTPPAPTPAALFGLEIEAAEIRNDLGMGLLHLPGGASDSALEWFSKAEARLLLLELALHNAARGQAAAGMVRR